MTSKLRSPLHLGLHINLPTYSAARQSLKRYSAKMDIVSTIPGYDGFVWLKFGFCGPHCWIIRKYDNHNYAHLVMYPMCAVSTPKPRHIGCRLQGVKRYFGKDQAAGGGYWWKGGKEMDSKNSLGHVEESKWSPMQTISLTSWLHSTVWVMSYKFLCRFCFCRGKLITKLQDNDNCMPLLLRQNIALI